MGYLAILIKSWYSFRHALENRFEAIALPGWADHETFKFQSHSIDRPSRPPSSPGMAIMSRLPPTARPSASALAFSTRFQADLTWNKT